LFVDFDYTFVLGQVTAVVTEGENAPFGSGEFNRVGQTLEYEVAIFRAKSVEA
jgi:hypothetical protein